MNSPLYITVEPAEIVFSFSASHKHRGPSAIAKFKSRILGKKCSQYNSKSKKTNIIFEELK